jgi:flagellar motility protein MotE (MotC chaperone)
LLPLLLAADTPKVAPERLAKQLLELEVRETALRELEQDLNQKIQTLEELRQQTLAIILPGEKERQGQLDTLIKFYQAMKPQSAARLLEKLPTPLAADVLSSMKSRGAGKILNVMNADKAVQISKLMAGQKK